MEDTNQQNTLGKKVDELAQLESTLKDLENKFGQLVAQEEKAPRSELEKTIDASDELIVSSRVESRQKANFST